MKLDMEQFAKRIARAVIKQDDEGDQSDAGIAKAALGAGLRELWALVDLRGHCGCVQCMRAYQALEAKLEGIK